jgi:predicted O-methyltransferase YrrM
MFDPANPRAIVTQLEEMVADVPGWSPVDQLYSLFLLAYLSKEVAGDLVEVGAWCGRSSIALGLAAKLSGNSCVYAVDLFPTENEDGTFSLRVKIDGKVFSGYDGHRLWREPYERSVKPLFEKHHGILDIFRETMVRNSLASIVEPVRGMSGELASPRFSGHRFRMAFIDGDHSYEAVCRDIRNVMPRLAPGGWLCFDDAFSSYEGVDRAIRELVISDPGMETPLQLTRKLFVARKRAA